MGFCFGGGNALELARSGASLDAVVSLHGDLQTTMPAKPGDIKAAVFVIHGSKDPVAPKADRDALEAEMDGVGANWQPLDFGGRLQFVRRGRDHDEGRRRVSRRRRASDLLGCWTASSRTRSTRSSKTSPEIFRLACSPARSSTKARRAVSHRGRRRLCRS